MEQFHDVINTAHSDCGRLDEISNALAITGNTVLGSRIYSIAQDLSFSLNILNKIVSSHVNEEFRRSMGATVETLNVLTKANEKP